MKNIMWPSNPCMSSCIVLMTTAVKQNVPYIRLRPIMDWGLHTLPRHETWLLLIKRQETEFDGVLIDCRLCSRILAVCSICGASIRVDIVGANFRTRLGSIKKSMKSPCRKLVTENHKQHRRSQLLQIDSPSCRKSPLSNDIDIQWDSVSICMHTTA